MVRRRQIARFALGIALAVSACEAGSDGADGGGADTDGDGGTGEPGGDDESDAMFDPDRVIEIGIELSGADWDEIRHQGRTIQDIFGPGCLYEPFGSPFTYVPGTVTVDGMTLGRVGVRKKGFLGSLDDERPSLKLKFDELVPNQKLSGMQRMTLNNNLQDPSALHQCLGYGVFTAAGVPAPRCNYAHVTVNGKDLGIYTHVESVKKQFLRRHFDDDEGQLYEGTLSDFQESWKRTFEQKTNDAMPYDRSDIDAVVAALERPDDELIDTLEQVVDVDAFLTFWATEVLIGHWDGYSSNTNNYFAYHDPVSDQFQFMPWGIDDILADSGDEEPDYRSFFATGEISRRLYQHPDGQARYVERMRNLLDTVWDEDAMLGEIDRMEALLDPFVGDGNDPGVDDTREFVANQRERITSELDGGPPTWEGGPREEICFEEIGTVDVTFDTSWSTVEGDPFADGSGTMDIVVQGTMLMPAMVGASSSPNDEPGEEGAVVQVVGLMPDDSLVFVWAEIRPDLFEGGMSIEIDWSDAFVIVAEYDQASGQDSILGMLGGGTVALEAASMTSGGPVRGSISGPLVTSFF